MKPSNLLAAAVLACYPAAAPAQSHSELWGEKGELWNPAGPLADYSQAAGYRGGLTPTPRRPVRVNVRDFGAVGDGVADDTRAIVEAIKACPPDSAVFLPAGKYLLTEWIRIEGLRNITIRGEDMFETQLVVPKGLEDLHPSPTKTTGDLPTTKFSWSGGFFWFNRAEELGIENLSFIFPDLMYPGHFKERGYNMIQLSGTNNWVHNVRGWNADSGIFNSGSYTTFSNILLDAFSGRANTDPQQAAPIDNDLERQERRAGHHGMDMQGGSHNLIERYVETVKFIHGLGHEGKATWNVWHRCKGPDIEIDHHTNDAGMTYNLFTDIDMGLGQGAEGQRNIHTAAEYETFWNLRSSRTVPFDPTGSGIRTGVPAFIDDRKYLVVGWDLDWPEAEKAKRSTTRPWYELIGRHDDILPANIYLAQVKKRLNVDNLPPDVRITRPVAGVGVRSFAGMKVTVMADDRDGSLAGVELRVDGRSLGTLTSPPFEWTLADPAVANGVAQIVAVATDDRGARGEDSVRVEVTPAEK